MRIVTASDDLTSACERLSASDFVAVDTEFMREQTFWPQLCLVQLATPDEALILDPMAPRHRSGAVLVADGQRAHRQGVPRRAPGHRDRVRQDRAGAQAGVRHANRRHGLRVRRIDLLRQPGEEGDGRRPRQILALHRLEPPAAVGQSADLRAGRRDAPARRLSPPQDRDRGDEPLGMAERGDGRPHRPQDLRIRTPTTPGSV